MKDIVTLEKIQRRATKYIVSDPSLDYRGRLISLKLLPLMYFCLGTGVPRLCAGFGTSSSSSSWSSSSASLAYS